MERLLDFATRSRWGKHPIARADAAAAVAWAEALAPAAPETTRRLRPAHVVRYVTVPNSVKGIRRISVRGA